MSVGSHSLFRTEPLAVPPTLDITLRPYQSEALDGVFDWWEKGGGNPLVIIPTGGGKSLILAGLIHQILLISPSERILVLTHVKELIEQNHRQLLRCWPGAPAGIYSAGVGRREHDAQVCFAGIQSVHEKAARIGRADLVFIDEAHLVPKEGMGMYRKFLGALRSMNSHLKVVGLTATPFRTDSGLLHEGEDRLFDGIAYTADLVRLVREGYLSPIVAKHTGSEIDTLGVHTQAGEFVAKELEAAAMAGDLVATSCAEIVRRGADRKQWLVFTCGIGHAEAVADELRRHGIDCETIFGETDKGDRAEIIDRFKGGRLRCIVNVNVLTTGFDAPAVDLIAILRPTKSPGLFVQMCGRGLRIAEGKANCLLLDFGGNLRRHGPLDQVRAQVRARKPGEGSGEAPVKTCPICESEVAAAALQCPDCGYEWPPREIKHDERPDHADAIAGLVSPADVIQRWQVQRVRYSYHHKTGKEHPVLRVQYECGFQQRASEWVCFDHPGYPRKKACQWWTKAGGKLPHPCNVAEAEIRAQENRELPFPREITVDTRGKYPTVLAAKWERDEAGSDDDGSAVSGPEVDLPF